MNKMENTKTLKVLLRSDFLNRDTNALCWLKCSCNKGDCYSSSRWVICMEIGDSFCREYRTNSQACPEIKYVEKHCSKSHAKNQS